MNISVNDIDSSITEYQTEAFEVVTSFHEIINRGWNIVRVVVYMNNESIYIRDYEWSPLAISYLSENQTTNLMITNNLQVINLLNEIYTLTHLSENTAEAVFLGVIEHGYDMFQASGIIEDSRFDLSLFATFYNRYHMDVENLFESITDAETLLAATRTLSEMLVGYFTANILEDNETDVSSLDREYDGDVFNNGSTHQLVNQIEQTMGCLS